MFDFCSHKKLKRLVLPSNHYFFSPPHSAINISTSYFLLLHFNLYATWPIADFQACCSAPKPKTFLRLQRYRKSQKKHLRGVSGHVRLFVFFSRWFLAETKRLSEP